MSYIYLPDLLFLYWVKGTYGPLPHDQLQPCGPQGRPTSVSTTHLANNWLSETADAQTCVANKPI